MSFTDRAPKPSRPSDPCCEECASGSPANPPPTVLTPLTKVPLSRRAAAAAGERSVTALGVVLAAGFVLAAVASLAGTPAQRLGAWVPVHLLLAGAATTAIAGVMPFFSAAVSGAPPARYALRLAGVLGIAVGAVLVTVGRAAWVGDTQAASAMAGIGGLVFVAALVAVAAATILPLRAALGPRRLFMGLVYGVAVVNVIVGASLATLLVLGWSPVAAGWAALKPAHAWLNVFGFLSLVIAGSLLHLLPTVAGARIRRTAASMVVFVGLAAGPPMVAAGFILSLDALAIVGAVLTVVGAGALAVHAVVALRSRGRWTTDLGWHAFATWSLVAGIGWFVAGAAIAAGQVIVGGTSPAGWSLNALQAPLGIGFVAQVLVGAWSHLLPAVGPGSPEQHSRQRRILGQLGLPRMALLNGGVLAIVVGEVLDMQQLVAAGIAGVVVTALVAVALFGAAALSVPFARPSARNAAHST